MRVALVQLDIAWEDKQANFERVKNLLADISFAGTDGLIVLPELFATGFTMDSEKVAESDLGETESFLAQLAREKKAYVVGGVAKNLDGGELPGNFAVVASPDGEIIFRYQKTHPFSHGTEDQHYTRGKKFDTCELGGFIVCPTICYDLRFPELYRIGADKGAQIYINIANWPNKRSEHWKTLLKARAIENQAYVIGVNRCGDDPNLSYSGDTMLVDFMGEVMVDAGSREGVVEAELSLDELQSWRDHFPALRDRNSDIE